MKILVAVDGSECSRTAVEFVASRQMFIQSDPAIHVLHVRSPLPAIRAQRLGRKLTRAYYAEEAENVLKPAQVRLQKAGVRPKMRCIIGQPAMEIAKTADKDNVDLLVLGSHGHSALAGMLVGSVTNEVLVRTKRPVLIVLGKAKRYPDSLKVGIAVDGSSSGPVAVRYVLRHPELFGTSLNISLIHVVPEYDLKGMPSRAGYVIPEFSPKEVKALHDHAFERAVAPVRKLFKGNVGVKLNEVRLVGNAGPEVSAYASKKLDLLVLGAHGYGAFKAAVMGSVATRVIARSEVPVILIRRTAR